MQPNDITLVVDTANNGTTTDVTLKKSDYFQNRSVYSGPLHSSLNRDTLNFYRAVAKQNGNFRGVDKSSVKFSKDYTVPGVDSTSTLVSPVIIEVNFSIPVGVSAATIKEMRQRVIALLDNDLIMDDLNIKLMV